MFLKQVYLNRSEYGPSRGNLEGTVTFVGDNGEIKLTIGDEQARAFVRVFADALVSSSKEIAERLTAEVIESDRPLLT